MQYVSAGLLQVALGPRLCDAAMAGAYLGEWRPECYQRLARSTEHAGRTRSGRLAGLGGEPRRCR